MAAVVRGRQGRREPRYRRSDLFTNFSTVRSVGVLDKLLTASQGDS